MQAAAAAVLIAQSANPPGLLIQLLIIGRTGCSPPACALPVPWAAGGAAPAAQAGALTAAGAGAAVAASPSTSRHGASSLDDVKIQYGWYKAA